MERRDFLIGTGVVGAGLTLGSLRYGQRLHARIRLKEDLLGHAQPVLTRKALRERRELPAIAAEQIRTWFHGPCLNAAAFAARVCSEPFQTRLTRCPPSDHQSLFLTEFLALVATQGEIAQQVGAIAGQVGGELNRNWDNCCREIATKWNAPIREHGLAMPTDFAATLAPHIKAAMQDSIAAAQADGDWPPFSEPIRDMGQSAVLLLRALPRLKPAVPLFVLLAVAHLGRYVMALYARKQAESTIRHAVSARMADLGNRLGSGLEEEARTRIEHLHQWQEAALRADATRRAKEAIHIL